MTINLRHFGFRQNWFKRYQSSWMLRCAAGNPAYSSWAHEHSDMKATHQPKRRNTLNNPLQRLTSRNTTILCISLRGCPFVHEYCWNLCQQSSDINCYWPLYPYDLGNTRWRKILHNRNKHVQFDTPSWTCCPPHVSVLIPTGALNRVITFYAVPPNKSVDDMPPSTTS